MDDIDQLLEEIKCDAAQIMNVITDISANTPDNTAEDLSAEEIERAGRIAVSHHDTGSHHICIYVLNHKVSENDMALIMHTIDLFKHVADYYAHKHTSQPTISKEDKHKVHLSWNHWGK
jgi:hypothetical protein